MDWDNVVVILLWLWVIRWALGVGYGFYLIRKQELHKNLQGDILCGPIFWIGWALGVGLRRLARWLKRIRSQRTQ